MHITYIKIPKINYKRLQWMYVVKQNFRNTNYDFNRQHII